AIDGSVSGSCVSSIWSAHMPTTTSQNGTGGDTRVATQRRALPDAPGVYLFRDRKRRVLYVGKAKSLRKRVASHFSSPSTKGAHGMLDELEHIEVIATQTEAEALPAAQNFIRQYRPRHNVPVRDDKSYPYLAGIDNVVAFLSGHYRQIEDDLEEEMHRAADAQEFEQAAMYRNRLKAVRSLLERQRISNATVGTLDAIAVAAEGTDANAQVFQVRDGVLADRQSFYLDNQAARDEAEVAEEFVLQYYATSPAIPPQVIVGREVADSTGSAIAEALDDRRGAPVEVRHAERGDKRRIYELALRNARLALDQDRLRSEHRRVPRVEARALP